MPRPGDDFRAPAAVTLDATGAGTVSVAPPGGVTWNVTSISCVVSTRVKEPTFKLYLDGTADSQFLESSFTGSQDTTDTPRQIRDRTIFGVWSGGDAGARATMIVVGTYG